MKGLRPEALLLGLILAVMLPLRAYQTAMTEDFGIDGGYYVEVARHVRDGLGLTSHTSLYHAADTEFPHKTSIYPLWPLLLGYGARLFPLEELARWLPFGLSFTALGFAYAFGRRLDDSPLLPSLVPGFHAGHLMVLMLGLQRDFIGYGSMPFTEPLAWTLTLACLWRALGARRSWWWAIELGIWASLLYFCRAQLIVVPLAAVLAGALPVLAGPDRLRALGRLGLTAGVIGGALGAWLAYLRGFVHEAGPGALLRFDQNRASGLLAPFDVIVNEPGLTGVALDRLEGLVYGWDLASGASYIHGFYASHWALPLALPTLLSALWARRAGLGDALRGERAEAVALLVLTAAGGLASVQLAHKQFNSEWYFNNRQAMICVLAFFLAQLWLLRQSGRLTSLLGGALLATSTLTGVHVLASEAFNAAREHGVDNGEVELGRWLRRLSDARPVRVILSTGKLQRVAWRTENVGYHWFYEKTTYEDLLKMTDQLGAEYIIFTERGTEDWLFRKQGDGAIQRDFEEVLDPPSPFTVLRRRPALPPPAPRPRVLVIGVDGASWKVMGPMIEAGELPTFARLRAEGASQLAFDTLEVTDSPVIWTTVATGQPPEVHGVKDYTMTLEDGQMVPVTSEARKVPALWNVASGAGLSVLAINWWASWPAESVRGQVVSDHANPAAAGWMEGKYWDADPSALSALRKDTWPPELADKLASTWIDPANFPLDEVQTRAALSPEHRALLEQAPMNQRETWSWFKTFFALDQPHTRIAIEQLQSAPADLTLLYLRGPDPVQHYAWHTVEPHLYASPPPFGDRDRGVVQAVYRYVDTLLAELLAATDERTVVIVLSDHGAEPARGATRPGFIGRPGSHTRIAKGVLFFWGAHVRRGASLGEADPFDIAPTVAWLLGLPVPEDTPGRVLIEAFDESFQRGTGRVYVRSWGTRAAKGESTASPADANMLEQLRGLGYIE